VAWTNNDNFTHSVQFTDGGLPSEPMMMERGQTASFMFASAGTFHYRCSLHPQNMKGSVTVTP
jgi:plastocyanin